MDTDLTGDLPTNTYRVVATGYDQGYEPMITTERSLTGLLQTHRLRDNGDTKVYSEPSYTLLLTREEKDQLVVDLGEQVYFMPHYRDEGDALNYRMLMTFSSIADCKPMEPMIEWWQATIKLEEV
ncbi:MAG: hypothetical protein ACYSYL_00100 [Planctomycetota bacterium]